MEQSLSSVKLSFFAWTDSALSQRIPDTTVAFHFNLYEGEDSVHVQLMGTDSFVPGEVPERDYWPGSETFTTGEDIFEIPYAVAGKDWQAWLQTSVELVRSYIASGEKLTCPQPPYHSLRGRPVCHRCSQRSTSRINASFAGTVS